MTNKLPKIELWSVFLLLNLLSFWGALIYKLYRLDTPAIIASVFLTGLSFYFLQKIKPSKQKKLSEKLKQNKKDKFLSTALIFLYLLLVGILFVLLLKSSSQEPLTSPWEVIPPYFFVIYFFGFITLLFLLGKTSRSLGLFFIGLHYFLSFSIALIIYKIGYGFDPFIHEATMELIAEKGRVEPKPLYYLSQYSLIIILHKLFFIPISFLNKFLVPLLASIYLPKAIYEYLSEKFSDQRLALYIPLLILILPFPFLIMTTPQNLAYLFLLIIILKALSLKNYYELAFLYILALVALLAQPIAGIPALLFCLAITFYHSEWPYRKILNSLVFFLMVLALPFSFYFFEKSSFQAPELNNNFTKALESAVLSGPDASRLLSAANTENAFLNAVYFYGFNLKIFLLAVFIFAIFLFYRHKKECRVFGQFLMAFLAMFASYILVNSLSFSYLIDYERQDYGQRILLAAAFFMMPFLLLFLYSFAYSLGKKNKSFKIALCLFVALLATASLYLSYPRLDSYHNSHGISTGKNDLLATAWVEENHDHRYIALANQQVSAAALKNFGFNNYYSQGIFFYPIPTSGPLYQIYLDMVYQEPSRKNALKAMDLVNVNEAYFILNKYWWAFPKIVDEAKLAADSYHIIGDEDIYIFKYVR